MKRPISEQIRSGLRSQGSELTQDDIGTFLSPQEGFGPVLEIDIGKRVWLKPYGFTMENNEQRDKRKMRIFEVKAGRQIYRNGEPFIFIGHDENISPDKVSPCEYDELTHIICALLNKLGPKDIDTTYLGGSCLKLK